VCVCVSTRPPYKHNSQVTKSQSHNLLCLTPFDLTDLSETFQQTTVLRLSHCCHPLHIVASRILRLFEFDGQKFSIHCVQSNSIQSSSPESLLILIFWYWQPLLYFLPRDFHFLLFRCFPQFILRAKLRTLFLIPEGALSHAQAAFPLELEDLHVPIRFPMHINLL